MLRCRICQRRCGNVMRVGHAEPEDERMRRRWRRVLVALALALGLLAAGGAQPALAAGETVAVTLTDIPAGKSVNALSGIASATCLRLRKTI